MKKTVTLLVLITSISTVTFGQTWQETWSTLTKEEKITKMNRFRSDNQKFLKDSLGMTSEQLKAIDSVNSAYLNEMKRIEKSNVSDDAKLSEAKEFAKKRGEALDTIMGEEKHQRFSQYLYKKLEKEQG